MPQNGMEFFFSGIMIKVFQLPLLFCRSNADDENLENKEGTFLALIYDK